MAFSRPTLQQIVDRISADITAKITGATTLALRSVLLILGKVYAGAVHLLYGYLDNMSKELFVTTATADASGGKLDTQGAEFGIIRRAAAKAVGIITCSGTPATNIPAGSALTSTAGNRYTTDALAVIGAGGTVTVAITCDTAGAAGNDVGSITLSFESPIAGVNSTATVSATGLIDGEDDETDDAYRQRVLSRKQLAPHGGANHDVVAWAKEVSGVTRAWIQQEYMGRGTFAMYFVIDGQTPITPSTAQIAAVRAHLLSHVDVNGTTVGLPVTAENGLSVLAPTIKYIDLLVKLYPNTAAVQAAVQAELEDFLRREGVGGSTLYLSRMLQAMSSAAAEERSEIIDGADIGLQYHEVPVLRGITWYSY